MLQLWKKKQESEQIPSRSDEEVLYEFLTGNGPDKFGHTSSQLLMASDIDLETDHTYIQSMFPTNRVSNFCDATCISEETAQKWGLESQIASNMHLFLMKMLLFFGFELVSNLDVDQYQYVLSDRNQRVVWILHEERANTWLHEENHNLFRLSRILESLRLFRMKADHEMVSNLLLSLMKYKSEIQTWSCWPYWEAYMNYEVKYYE